MTIPVETLLSLFPKSRRGQKVEDVVAATLREAIRTRKLEPGSALPSTRELARVLKANLNAVNRALALLAAEGYLERRRHVGTLIAEPESRQRCVVALIGGDLRAEFAFMSRRLYQLIEEELARRNTRLRCIDKLHALASPDPKVAAEATDALIKELIHASPTALIFDRFALERHAELHEFFTLPGIVRSARPGDACAVTSHKEQIVTEGIPYLKRCGCKRLVLVTLSSVTNPDNHFFSAFWKQLKTSRMECEQIVELYDAQLKEGTTHECHLRVEELLARRARQPPEDRFDALIVRDDTVMRGAATALLKAGVDVPFEVRVLVQTNRGINHYYGLNVDRLELPLESIAHELVEALEEKIMAPSRPQKPRVVPAILKPCVIPPSEARAREAATR